MPAPYSSPLAEALAPDALDRLIRYARVDTQSARDRTGSPSTPGQLELARLLVAELRDIGLGDAELDDNGYVFATLPGTVPGTPVIGLLAHVDTSPDAPGAGVEPLVHRDYGGGVIALPRGGTVLDPERIPELRAMVGHDLVSSSGDTLLGADDKAGVAEVMAAVAHLAAHPELPRATVRVGFTPDEEVGQGASLFDIERFGATCAYTFDGSAAGELQDETFTAAQATLVIHGVDMHPGWAKGKLVNAATLAGRVLAALPRELTPERTEGRAGFIHVVSVAGDAVTTTISAIVRDFDDDKLAEHAEVLRRAAAEVVGAEPDARFELDVQPQYPNMRTFLDARPEVVAAAEEALRREGYAEPLRHPIRGGTDGSVLSARGLPTPNLFTGGREYHSVREWASVHEMGSAAAVAVRLAGVWGERAG